MRKLCIILDDENLKITGYVNCDRVFHLIRTHGTNVVYYLSGYTNEKLLDLLRTLEMKYLINNNLDFNHVIEVLKDNYKASENTTNQLVRNAKEFEEFKKIIQQLWNR